MKVEEVYSDPNENYKILMAQIPGGGKMPLHHATTNAFVMVVKGKAVLHIYDEEVVLREATSHLIPENIDHTLEVFEDFKAYIVLDGTGKIEFSRLSVNIESDMLLDKETEVLHTAGY